MSIPKSLFSTDDLVASKKYDAFHESIGVIFDVSSPEKTGKNFYANMTSHLLGECLFVECSTVGQQFKRPKEKIAKDGVDHFLLQIFLEGHTRRVNSEKESIGQPGNIIVIDTAKPWEAINSDFKNLSLVIPRRLIAPKLLHEDDHHGSIITQENPFGKILYNYILSLVDAREKMISTDMEAFGEISFQLIAAALNKVPMKSADTKSMEFDQVRLKYKIKNYLEMNLANPDLSIAQVASNFKISRSHFYRIFDSEDGPGNYLRNRRLKIAYKKLVTSEPRRHLISDIAYEVGYANVSAFRRAFKSKFNISPNDLKQIGLNEVAQKKLPTHRVWEEWFLGL